MPVSEEDLRDSRNYLSEIGAWPSPTRLYISEWLDNFDSGDDRSLASSLLESLVYISEAQVRYAAVSVFTAISSRPEFGPAGTRQENWTAFLEKVHVSFPAGAAGDVTGSGQIFARAVRDAGFPEGRIRAPEDCVARLEEKQMAVPIVFLDDMSGTGTQFARTWTRNVETRNGKTSLAELSERGLVPAAYYLPIAATSRAIEKIAEVAPSVVVQPAYVVEEEYFASSERTRLVPDTQRSLIPQFVEKYVERTGHRVERPYGYGDMGLAISFHHATPNNTLPVLQGATEKTEATWRTLIS